MRGNSAVFLQTGHFYGIFSIGTEKDDFTGFFIQQVRKEEGIGVRIRLIFPCGRV